MGNVPKPPIESRLITKTPGIGRDDVDRQRIPRFTVDHSMVGTLVGTDSFFRVPSTAALTDFGVGSADAGNGYAKIYQWNDIHGKQIGWASGPVKTPQGDGPRILAAFGGANGLNQFGVSIEHEDGGNINTPMTAAAWSASAWLHAWLHAEEIVPHQTAATFDLNAHHREFCGSAYKDCPFPRIYNYTEEFQTAIKAIMAHWQDGVPYPAGGVFINGKRLTVPINTTSNKLPTQPTAGLKVVVPGTNETFWIVDPLLSYYNKQGGFATFGYPQSGMYTEDWGEAKGLVVQYFERARLEIQPNGTITQGRIGSELLRVRSELKKVTG